MDSLSYREHGKIGIGVQRHPMDYARILKGMYLAAVAWVERRREAPE